MKELNNKDNYQQHRHSNTFTHVVRKANRSGKLYEVRKPLATCVFDNIVLPVGVIAFAIVLISSFINSVY